MKLPAFAYQRADSVEEATSLLANHDARILAGGQSLLPLMALRLSQPELLVDISAAADLRQHTVHEDALEIPAALTARTAETRLRAEHPLLADCLARVGHVEIRNRGTVCGAVAHADPAAELPALLLALDGTVQAASAQRTRAIPAADFFHGPYLTALEEGEMVTGIKLPKTTAHTSVQEIARRDGDFALVGAITVLNVQNGRCTEARIALFGIAGVPLRASKAEEILTGQPICDELLDEAAARAFDDIDVLGDLHGSATYRRRAGTYLLRGALREASHA